METRETDSTGGGDTWVTVAFPKEFFVGHLVRGMLDSAGIPVLLLDWYGQVVYEGSEPLEGPYRIAVPRSQEVIARSLLESADVDS